MASLCMVIEKRNHFNSMQELCLQVECAGHRINPAFLSSDCCNKYKAKGTN